MRRRGFVAAALLVVAASSVCLWLNVPKSLQLLAQGVGQQRHPVEFDFEFIGIDPGISRVPVQLFYLPQTPIFGLTKHYSSIIAPLSIDTITRSLDVDVRAGRVRFTAPLGLAGLSNYRLQSVDVGEADAPYALTSSIELGDPSKADRAKAPRSLDLPLIGVSDGQVHFDGAIALWRRSASEAHDDANPYAYSPLAQGPAQLIWVGLRGLTARIDLAPYPVGTFAVPAGWEGGGWKNEGDRSFDYGRRSCASGRVSGLRLFARSERSPASRRAAGERSARRGWFFRQFPLAAAGHREDQARGHHRPRRPLVRQFVPRFPRRGHAELWLREQWQ
jgi:hypothetical protein